LFTGLPAIQATLVETGETVAVKKVLQDRRFKSRELELLKLLKHTNVIELKKDFVTRGDQPEKVFLNLVFEFVPETIYRIIKHHARTQEQIPLIFVKVRQNFRPGNQYARPQQKLSRVSPGDRRPELFSHASSCTSTKHSARSPTCTPRGSAIGFSPARAPFPQTLVRVPHCDVHSVPTSKPTPLLRD
jgi:hypothetical protein